MVAAIFNTIGDIVTAFLAVLGDGISGVTSTIWDPTLNTGAGGLTTFGTFLLIGFGVGLVYWAFRLVKGLVRR